MKNWLKVPLLFTKLTYFCFYFVFTLSYSYQWNARMLPRAPMLFYCSFEMLRYSWACSKSLVILRAERHLLNLNIFNLQPLYSLKKKILLREAKKSSCKMTCFAPTHHSLGVYIQKGPMCLELIMSRGNLRSLDISNGYFLSPGCVLKLMLPIEN